MADTFYEQIRVHIEAMQEKLKKNEQLLIYHYCPSGQPVLITSVGFQNPSMIVLNGLDSMGNECCVLTHMTSVQLVVRVMEVDSQQKHRKIGFMRKTSPIRS